MTAEKAPPRSFPFSRERRSCIRCGAITFYVRFDGVPICPKHMNRKKSAEPIRRDRDGDMRGARR